MAIVGGKTKIVGVIGYPIEHTLSPLMHNKAFEYLGLNYVYAAFSVKPGFLKEAINSLEALNICGINVTIPHKENVIKYLDKTDGLAKKIGAVNTIVNLNGDLIGYNTDAYGFLKSLKKRFNPGNKNVFMFGAGGVARAIGYVLLTQRINKIYVTDKDNSKALKLVRRLGTRNSIYIPHNKDKIKEVLSGADLFINATPVGMHADDPCVVNPDWLHKNLFIYDVVYNRETQLTRNAKLKKIPYLDGIDMFVNQGAVAFEYWIKKAAPIKVMYKTVKTALRRH
jgi:shikimate dehydrogenase